MRHFWTQGPVNPQEHYVVSRTKEIADFIKRVEEGRYLVLRKNPRFESVLMRIMARDKGVDFNMDDDIINELATYGVIKRAPDGMCEILNPIYLYRIMRTFKPTVNGLEDEYLEAL